MNIRLCARPAWLALAAILAGSACSPAPGDVTRPGDVAAASSYFCPMHTDYRSDKPGNCPICSMKLVPVQDGNVAPGAGSVSWHAPVAIPVDLQKRIGLSTSLVETSPFSRTIRASGRVEVDERRLSVVSPRYGGWIEDLRVQAVGAPVQPGDVLFVVYSPELYEAQRTYLAVRAALPASDEAVVSSRQRLLLWEMTDEQVRDLEARGEPEPRTPVLSKVGGIVTRREALLGMRFEAGATLFEIADLSTVWVIADVHAEEMPLLKLGAEASIEFASAPGERIPGRIAFVYPTISESTRTARARIEVANPDRKRTPGEYATVSIPADLGEQLAVDVDAVIDTGTRQIAFVAIGEDRFEPREVKLGARNEGRVVVLSGLAAGERVVASATFLVDSESRLKSALRAHVQPGGDPSGHSGH